jgi:hypothetical protein
MKEGACIYIAVLSIAEQYSRASVIAIALAHSSFAGCANAVNTEMKRRKKSEMYLNFLI